ncbi:hypothetical protein CO058_01830 [candidate division WWE3 bacterium CG_4_9_14_0_2_um_filter_35_11]|uniref:Uncharacterized protein n=1 Tax=candidate division WWE3 bacterium CG_4_9_14_0_2_um_filter_35_11 TaxID=1975077 RepID=A0A2M8ELX6_UNCKA|nr:MAG: hypothetical protein COV25_04170 [candidate division WWE3 bacterium CG10_big_fil_rev_8_21_14_0_10_35_32]PJC23746.1 MAG: hypothetical protein CO058_01830 [candidate division WWE3 bacterium CG_4_9_14_0_2_um_filter_35_11]
MDRGKKRKYTKRKNKKTTLIAFVQGIFAYEIRIRLISFKTLVAILVISAFYVVSSLYFYVLKDLPSPNQLAKYDPKQTTTIYDRKGNILYRIYSDEDRIIAKIEDIPQDVINATTAIEDQTFYTHKGISIRGITRAAKSTLLDKDLEGGSTITQQLVKNTLLTPERTWERKVKEAVVAIEVERRYSKSEILEMYLNRIPYGGTAYGIRAAAKRYFGKDLSELLLSEAAYLAGLPAAPSKYSPFIADKSIGKARQQEVLSRMYALGYISKTQLDEALNQDLTFQTQTEYIKAPHFVNYVISQLEQNYGQSLVKQGGLDVFTSLDPELQASLENIVSKNVENLQKYGTSNGASIITNPNTGEILAMVGSADYFDLKNDGNVNIATSLRQPGSSIKPVTYALALESGYTELSKIADTPIVYAIPGAKYKYAPVNYDGKFHGNVTLKNALGSSYNIPAVKLLDSLGVANLVEFAKKLGITTWTEPERYGLSLTLGAGEVTMIDMATVYGTFANLGYKKQVTGILKVYDSYGNVMEENSCVSFLDGAPSILTKRAIIETKATASTEQNPSNIKILGAKCERLKVISSATAYTIGNILSDNKARTPAFGPSSSLNVTSKEFAVKTGTTTSVRDNWAIGYSNDFVVVSWLGNNDNKPMKNIVSGYRGASEIWRQAVDYLIANRKVKDKLIKPDDIVEVDICELTGTLACKECNNGRMIFNKGLEPKIKCSESMIKKIVGNTEEKKEG